MMWTQAGEGSFEVKVYRFGIHTETLSVKDDELNAHHKDFANAISALIEFSANSSDEPSVPGYKVIASLAVLNEDYYKFRDMEHGPRLLLDITHFDNPGMDVSYISGTCVELDFCQIYGRSVPYALGVYPVTFTATREELEVLHPGWVTRYKLGKELELVWVDLMRYAFTTPANTLVVAVPDDLSHGHH